MIAGIDVEEIMVGENRIGTVKKIRLRDNHAAIRTAMQVRKMIGADTKAEVTVNLADRMERARRRAKEGR